MKSINRFLFIFLCFSSTMIAQTPVFEWVKSSGSSSFEEAYSVGTDAVGNVYTVGYFQGTVDFDPGPGVTSVAVAGNQSGFITKFDNSGNFIWVKALQGTAGCTVVDLKIDAVGQLYLTGTFNGTFDFDPGVPVVNLSSSGTNSDIFVMKLDASGNYLWANRFGGSVSDGGYSITVDAVGNVYTTGTFTGAVDFDPGAGSFILTPPSGGNAEVFVLKLSASGNLVWAINLGGTGADEGRTIQVDASNNVLVSGVFTGTADFDPLAATANLISAGLEDAFVAKYDVNGAYSWAKRVGSSSSESCHSMVVDNAGNIYFSGRFSAATDFDPNAGTVTLTPVASSDDYVVKWTSSGTFVWAKQIGLVVSTAFGNALALDASNNLYITGAFLGTTDFNPGAGINNLTSDAIDIFVLRWDNSGNYVWAVKLGGSSSDAGNSISTFGTTVFSVGRFQGVADFNPSATTFNQTSSGQYDYYIHKLSQCTTPVAPTNTTSAINQQVCYGASTNLSATGLGTLSWYSQATGGIYLGSGATFATPLLTATTTYYVQDSTCTTSARTVVAVTVNPQLTSTLVTQTNLLCANATTGSATVSASGGTGPFSYAWLPSGGNNATATSLTAGTYTCTTTDAANCTVQQTVSLTQPPALTASLVAQTNISCNGNNTGAATVSASGGSGLLSYAWLPSGGTAATATNLTAGLYTCTVTDTNSCTVQQTVSLTQPPQLAASIATQTNVTCVGGNDGSAILSASGGTGPFNYAWLPSGGNSATATSLTAGTYTCTVTDTNACTVQQTVTITQPPVQTVTLSGASLLCVNDVPSPLSGTPAGGTFSGPGVSGSVFDPAVAGLGQHTVFYTYTDSSGCTTVSPGLSITVDVCNGLMSITNQPLLSSSPNPSAGVFSITVNQSGWLTVFTIDGREVYQTEFTSAGRNQVDLTSCGAGIYLLHYRVNGGQAVQRIVVQ